MNIEIEIKEEMNEEIALMYALDQVVSHFENSQTRKISVAQVMGAVEWLYKSRCCRLAPKSIAGGVGGVGMLQDRQIEEL